MRACLCYCCLPVVSCGPPNHDAHSTLSSSVFTFGSTVTVSCNPGFVLSNGQLATLTCTAQGVWDRSTPACNREFGDGLSLACVCMCVRDLNDLHILVLVCKGASVCTEV